MSLADVAIPIIMDVSLLVIYPMPLPKIILIMSCDLCLCIKCLVLWRFVCCAPWEKDAEEYWDAKNDGQNPSQAKSLEPISIQKLHLAAIETLIVSPQQGLMTEIQRSNKKGS